MFNVLLNMHSGAYTDPNPPLDVARAALEMCPDSSLVTAFSVEVFTNIGIALGNANYIEAPDILGEALDAVAVQDAAPLGDAVTLKQPDGTDVVMDPVALSKGIDQLLEANIAPAAAEYAYDIAMANRLNRDLSACPYSRDGQKRALLEAKGLAGSVFRYTIGYEASLKRLGQLGQACPEQGRAIVLEEIRGYKEAAKALANGGNPRESSCVAHDGLARLQAYRDATSPEQAQEESEAKTLNMLKAWEMDMNYYDVIVCQKDGD